MGCLDASALAALKAGRLSEPEAAAARDHVETCLSCARSYAQLSALAEPTGTAATRDLKGALPPSVPPPPPAPRIEKIGPYVLLEQLGEGGMGTVYTAYHPELDRKVALKLLLPQLQSSETASTGQARLLREAQAMAKLDHPHVVAVHDAGNYLEHVYLVMERVEGTTLREWLKAGPHPWARVIAVMLQAGRGLAAAHAVGLVHRDFKPANVLVGRDGRVRVADFGLARVAGAAEPAHNSQDDETTLSDLNNLATPITRAGSVLGTPAYMAPEQFLGSVGDAKSDQFSFCVTLYEALYGARPFDAKFDPLRPAAPRQPPKDRGEPRAVRDAVLRGLSLAPDLRFESMAQLLTALETKPLPIARLALGAALAVGVIALVGVLALKAFKVTPVSGCEDLERPLRGVWDDETRGTVQAAFRATKAEDVERAIAATTQQLDGFAAAWEAQLRPACVAATHAHLDDPIMTELTCLGRQRLQLRALVDVFAQADADVVGNGLKAAASLTPPAHCADPHVLATLPKPPTDSKLRTQVEALWIKIIGAKAESEAGKSKAAAELLEPLARQAHELGYRPLEADALYALGDAQYRAGDTSLGAATLSKAEHAAELSGDDLLAADIIGELGFLFANNLGQLREAHFWVDRGRMLLERSGTDVLVEARIENALSALSSVEGDDAGSLQHMRRAVELCSEGLGKTHPRTLRYRQNVGAVLVEQCRLDDAFTELTAVKRDVEAMPVPDAVVLEMTEQNLGCVLSDLGRLPEASVVLQDVLRRVEARRGSAGVGEIMGPIAQLHIAERRFSDALETATAAYDDQRAAADPAGTGVAAGVRGWALLGQGRAADAIAPLDMAIATLTAAENASSTDLIDPLTTLAQARLALKQPEKAIEPSERALAIIAKHCALPGQTARARFALARALKQLKRDPARVATLARQARDELATLGWKRIDADELTAFMKVNRIE